MRLLYKGGQPVADDAGNLGHQFQLLGHELTVKEAACAVNAVKLKPGWLARDISRASERASEWRGAMDKSPKVSGLKIEKSQGKSSSIRDSGRWSNPKGVKS